jgi:transcriptional regulator with XRE-family HTH domain
MGRKLSKPRPAQGAKLREMRTTAGLSQYELADLIGEPQSNIAVWELSVRPPRSDVLPKLASALGVTVEEILGARTSRRNGEQRGGPVGKVRKLFTEVSRLPKRQQEKVVEFVSAFVKQQNESRA